MKGYYYKASKNLILIKKYTVISYQAGEAFYFKVSINLGKYSFLVMRQAFVFSVHLMTFI